MSINIQNDSKDKINEINEMSCEQNKETTIDESLDVTRVEETEKSVVKAKKTTKKKTDTTLEITEEENVSETANEISLEEQKEPLQTEEMDNSMSNEFSFNLETIDQSMSNVSAGQIVDGKVVSVDEKEVLVDIGWKSEAAITINEFLPDSVPTKGDVIQVFVVTRQSGDGKPVLSKKRADFIKNISMIREAFQNNLTVTGKIMSRLKSGMIVDVLGVEAFLPGSQLALKSVPNPDLFINKEVPLKIVSLDEAKKNIIVSRRRVMEEEYEIKKTKLKEAIKVDAELDGEVKNITDYGAFVDLGGIYGLLHVSDMTYGKINHPSEMLNIGDKIKVKCLGFDDENNRVSLGLKQLVPHPWENIEAKFLEGTKVTGKVVNIAKYGAFVELEPGVEGLIHLSEMSWTKKISNPRQLLKEGDIISAIVLLVSKENQRISLGLKQMHPNPWLSIETRYPEGMILNRKIKNITTFGAFVEIEPEIDGLIHISDISWTKRIHHPKEVFKKGQDLEAVVLSVDKLLHRISLGLKQMKADPWENIEDKLPLNTEVVGIVTKRITKGIVVDIPFEDDFIEGFVPISHLALPVMEKTEEAFDVKDNINMKIIEIDIENRRLILSVKAYFFSREKNELKDYQKYHQEKVNKNKAKAQKKADALDKKKRVAEEKRRKAEEAKKDINENLEINPALPETDIETNEEIIEIENVSTEEIISVENEETNVNIEESEE